MQPWNYKVLAPWKKSYDQPRHYIKKQRHCFANKGQSCQSYCSSSNHVWMWELDYKKKLGPEELMLLNCGVGEDSWESLGLLDCKEIKPVHPKGNQSWIFTGWADPEAEAPIVWPPDAKNWLIEKDPDAGKDWRQEEKGMTEDKMVGWHHWLDGRESEQFLGVGDGQGSLAWCSPWGHQQSDTTK